MDTKCRRRLVTEKRRDNPVLAREALHFAGLAGAPGRPTHLIQDVTFDSLQRLAPRPRNSKLRCLLSNLAGLPPLPDWKVALREFVDLPDEQ